MRKWYSDTRSQGVALTFAYCRPARTIYVVVVVVVVVIGSKFLHSLFFFYLGVGGRGWCQGIFNYFYGYTSINRYCLVYVIFHRYLYGRQFKNVYFMVFLLYKVH